MASGKTLEMIEFAKAYRAPLFQLRPRRERDRTLRGKARIRARRAARRQQ